MFQNRTGRSDIGFNMQKGLESIETNYLDPAAPSLSETLLLKSLAMSLVFPEPLKRYLEERGTGWKLFSQDRILGYGPSGRFSNERTKAHVRDVGGEIVQTVEDMCGI